MNHGTASVRLAERWRRCGSDLSTPRGLQAQRKGRLSNVRGRRRVTPRAPAISQSPVPHELLPRREELLPFRDRLVRVVEMQEELVIGGGRLVFAIESVGVTRALAPYLVEDVSSRAEMKGSGFHGGEV
jgi:hypothetical protein